MPIYNIDAYSASSILVNGAAGSSANFIDANTLQTIEFTGSISSLQVSDDDGKMNADNYINEVSDDQSQQTVNGVGAYADYKLHLTDASGNDYYVYVVDVGESYSGNPAYNIATSYLVPVDGSNPPPTGVQLTVCGYSQTHGFDYPVPCFGVGTKIRMEDGSFKNVEDIEIGDVVFTKSGKNKNVLWVGSSMEEEPSIKMWHNHSGTAEVFTGNHGMLGRLLDGSLCLVSAKFMTGNNYTDYAVTEVEGPTKVFHIMLEGHELVQTESGLWSESYYCGGYYTDPDAVEVYELYSGNTEMPLAHERLRKRDISELSELIFN